MPTPRQCEDLARILGGTGESEHGICKVTVPRTDIDFTIMDIPSQAMLHHMFTFEPIPNVTQRTLNLGEMVLLQEEVPFVVRQLSQQGILISGIHNHWLFDEPHLIYIHMEARMRPREFAQSVADTLAAMITHRYFEEDTP